MAFRTYVVEVHHQGQFVRTPHLQYVRGKVDNFSGVDPDLMSLFDLRDALRQINVQDETLVY